MCVALLLRRDVQVVEMDELPELVDISEGVLIVEIIINSLIRRNRRTCNSRGAR